MLLSLITIPLSLWGFYYEQSVVGLNGNYGIRLLPLSLHHQSHPTLQIASIPISPTSSGGSHPQEELLNSTVMGLNLLEVHQQGLFSVVGLEVLLWLELAISNKPQYL